jgi:hypothetical protein
MGMILKNYHPHIGQQAMHYGMSVYRYLAMIVGVRGGKTHAGAREAGKQAWNARVGAPAAYCIVAPTYNMLDRTTWQEFSSAMAPFIIGNNTTKKIITLRNGKLVYGFSAEEPDKIRNVTANGMWIDEARECKDFKRLWKVCLGRVLSTGGKILVTTSPNSFDDIHDIFVANRKPQYGLVRFTTYQNTFLDPAAIDELASLYDEKFMLQELRGEFVIFEGAVYYTFNRKENAGALAFKLAQYNPNKPLNLCCDFNVDPMAWTISQEGINDQTKLREIYFIDEIYLKNSNTVECCKEFIARYPNHRTGINLYGDATGNSRSANSNITNWKIIEDELKLYGLHPHIPTRNPAERDRINAVNGMICNSKGQRRVFMNPDKCPHLIRDCEQVSYKEGSIQIDKTKSLELTHASDSSGYMIENEFSLNKGKIDGLRI